MLKKSISAKIFFKLRFFVLVSFSTSKTLFFSNSWSKFIPLFEIIDFLKFKFLSKKFFSYGKVKNEKMTKRLIAENLNIVFLFFLSLILLFFVRLTIIYNIIIINYLYSQNFFYFRNIMTK